MKLVYFPIIIAFAFACKPIEQHEDFVIPDNTETISDGEDSLAYEEELDEEIFEPTIFRATRTVKTDLINTKLEVKFDWQNSYLIGKETLTAKPHFYASDSLYLDAKGMEIKTVALSGKQLSFDYSEDVLAIKLDKVYTKNESFTVVIDYVSKPDERTVSGSTAITSDKGLYFINPKGEKKNQMPQIWTQGETESSSVWFPTIDSPNSKTKQEIYITIDKKYTTLSNGKMLSSKVNTDGTRTDYWKQDLPHAPYLFMIAVGEFKVVKDTYKRADGKIMEVNYYVEPEWEASAKAIFGETPAMIAHFSKLLGVEYPWDKYSQIVVREYVSGAMENTGAVVFGDYVYKTERELLDSNYNYTIAHELFHHWFGDLVTCESWSNLTLNESFANYSQYLWDEHRYGIDEADFQAITEREGYYASALQNGYHPLAWFEYNDKEEMFDGHSYNKGGRILHMLRNYIGDEAFFAGIQTYLKENSFKAAEFHQLRIAFEQVSGEDLRWFFDQWYEGEGHPSLSVDITNDIENKNAQILVKQTQTTFPYFKMPVTIAVYDDNGIHTQRVWVNDKETTIEIPYEGILKNVIFDNDACLLAEIEETKPEKWYAFQFKNGKRYIQRKEALQYGTRETNAATDEMILAALNDPFWEIRATAMERYEKISADKKPIALEKIKDLATNDPKSDVRVQGLNVLSTLLTSEETKTLCLDRIKNDKSYNVQSIALMSLNKVSPETAIQEATKLQSDNNSKITLALCNIYAKSTSSEYLDYFQKSIASSKINGFDKIGILNAFTFYLSNLSPSNQEKGLVSFEESLASKNQLMQMYAPRFVGYLLTTAEEKMNAFKAEMEEAQIRGNANAADVAKGKMQEFEAVKKKCEELLSVEK